MRRNNFILLDDFIEKYNSKEVLIMTFTKYLGGFLWWLFIKFCQTDLETEQAEDKRIRRPGIS